MALLVIVASAIVLVAAAALVAWWASLRPSNEGDWQPAVSRVPTAVVDGDLLTVRNVRNFHHRGLDDFDERWEERRYDLAAIEGLDIAFSHWGSAWLAHTIMSWAFADGRHLAISIETRKRKGEAYSAVKGFFRQYELVYVAADERDVLRLRTHIRGEDVYVYRLRVSPLAARNLLVEYARAMNALAAKPHWYNALAGNCTTVIRQRVIHAGGRVPMSWKVFANGYLDELLYDEGMIETTLPFAELERASRINERALATAGDGDFSRGIRARK
jgi:hypothetical protein